MVSKRLRARRQDAVRPNKRQKGWRHENAKSTADASRIIKMVTDAVTAEGYPEQDVFAVRLSLEEAIVNALKHGNHDDPHKTVRVSYQLHAGRVGNPVSLPGTLVVKVEDQGAGFDPQQVADPTAPENLERIHGRGLMLMRKFMTSVRFNKRGTCVTMCKECSNC